jgi:hypothetical protein
MCTANMSVDSNATWSGVQNCSTSAWTWNDIPRHTSEHETDLAAQNQVVGAILHAETTCSSTTESVTEAPQARMVDVSWRDLRLQLSSLARHGRRSYILPRNDVSHDTHYSSGNMVRETFTISTPFLEWPIRIWTRNDTSRSCSGHHADVVAQSQTAKTVSPATAMRLSVSIRKMNHLLVSAFDRLDERLGLHVNQSRIENTISSYVGHFDGNTPSATSTTVSAASELLSLTATTANKLTELLYPLASGVSDLLGRRAEYQSPATVFWIDEFESSYSEKLDLVYPLDCYYSKLPSTSLWTWNDIPRDGNEFATGPVYQRDPAPPLSANVHAHFALRWNEIPRHSNYNSGRARTRHRSIDPVVRGICTSMWTWNDIPRDGNKCAMGSAHQETLCSCASNVTKARRHASVAVNPNWLTVGIG